MTDQLAVSVAKAAELIDVSVSSMKRLIDSGEIPVVTIVGHRKVEVEELRAYLARQRTGSSSRPAGSPSGNSRPARRGPPRTRLAAITRLEDDRGLP